MRKRCGGMPMQYLIGLLCLAAGGGMLLACLIPKCVFITGVVFICLGIWFLKK